MPSALVVFSTLVAALGGFLLGFDTAVIAGATRGLSAAFRLTPLTLGVTVSFALWGTVVGGVAASPIGERWGVRIGLRAMAVFYLVSAAGCALAWSWPFLLAFRFIGGLGIGGSSMMSPLYISEIAPPKWRGRLVSCFQFAVVLGILVAYASNLLVAWLHPGGAEWRYDLAATTVPAALFFGMLSFIPESPRWLAAKGRLAEARALLTRIGMKGLELAEDREAVDSGKTALFRRGHRKAIFIAVSIGVLNQFSGINAILYYLNDIFARAGFSSARAGERAVLIGLANLLFTCLAMLLIDSMGRRFLLVIGSVGMMGCLLGIARAFAAGSGGALLVWLLVAYIAFFAFSQGTVVWVYLSEIFPPDVRERGQSVGTFALWLANVLVTTFFPRMAASAGQYPFLIFAAMMLLQLLLTLFVLPETRGISIEAAAGAMEA